MIHYQEQNGELQLLETKEFNVRDFPDISAFDNFCHQQFQRIDRHAAQNIANVLQRFEAAQKRINNEM